MHHIAISENLRAVNGNWACQSFGLPDPMGAASDVRHDRNFFAHSFPTPVGKGICLEWAVGGKREVYEGLLELVERNIDTLEEQLGSERCWVSPQIVEREKAERRRLETEAQEAENERRTENTSQEEDCVLEQEGYVELMSAPRSIFSLVFDCLGGNVIISRCFRSGLLRRAGWRLLGWLEEVASGEYGEGEDDECRSQEYKISDNECHRSRTLDAHPLQLDSS